MMTRKAGCFAILCGLIAATLAKGQDDTLRAGWEAERPVTRAAPLVLRGTMAAGDAVEIVVTQAGTDVVAKLQDAQGRAVFTMDAANGAWGPETIVYVAPQSGEYRLEVTTAGQGSCRIQVLKWGAAGPAERERAAAFGHFEKAEAARKIRTAAARTTALAEYAAALPYFESTGDRYYQAVVHHGIGSVRAAAAQFRPALESLGQAGRLFALLGDNRRLATIRNFEGGVWDVLGEATKAREYYQQALALHRANSDRGGEGLVLNNLGILEGNLGNWQAALSNYQLGLPLIRATGDRRREGLVLSNLAVAHLGLGDAAEAQSLLNSALAVRKAVGDKRGEADTEGALGYTQLLLNRPAEALVHIARSDAIDQEAGDKLSLTKSSRNHGEALRRLGRLNEAETVLERGLALAREIQQRRQEAAVSELMAVVKLDKDEASLALPLAQAAVASFREMGDRAGEARAMATLARALASLGQLALAREEIEKSLTLAEAIRREATVQELRTLYLARRQNDYEFAIGLLMRMGQEGAAFTMSERARARGLLDMLAESGAGIRMDAAPELLAKERELNERLNALGARLLPVYGRTEAQPLLAQIREVENERRGLEETLRKTSPWYVAVTQPAPMGIERVQRDLLDAGTVLLEYALGEERSFLWAVTRSGFRGFPLPGRKVLEAQAGALLQTLAAQNPAATAQAAQALSDSILAPAAEMLGGERLVVVADGALQRVPFAMLPRPGGNDPLVVTMETVNLPSASALALLRDKSRDRREPTLSLAMFADPVFTGAPAPARMLEHLSGGTAAIDAVPQLPFTRREAERIGRLIPKGQSLIALGAKANRAVALSPALAEYRYVHFATHGYIDPERPGLSALLLSFRNEKGDAEDGFLRVNDIYDLNFRADLVVLSACQTGLGQEVRGEGLVGLPRAFLYAGAPRVVVSLWNVNDQATADLMVMLYRQMLKRGLRPAAALRQAQLAMRKQKRWAAPYYWAAFVQQGEWR
jgi:CHAT domain-containing protein/tetratricopeptide (TPR) repeat protein